MGRILILLSSFFVCGCSSDITDVEGFVNSNTIDSDLRKGDYLERIPEKIKQSFDRDILLVFGTDSAIVVTCYYPKSSVKVENDIESRDSIFVDSSEVLIDFVVKTSFYDSEKWTYSYSHNGVLNWALER